MSFDTFWVKKFRRFCFFVQFVMPLVVNMTNAGRKKATTSTQSSKKTTEKEKPSVKFTCAFSDGEMFPVLFCLVWFGRDYVRFVESDLYGR